MGVEIISWVMVDHLPPMVLWTVYKEAFKFCDLRDVHPNITTKLIHFSLSYFYLITVMTCYE